MNVSVIGEGPTPTIHDLSSGREITAFGSPSIDGRILTTGEKLADLVKNPDGTARSLDGEFVVLVESTDDVILINDRFGALPVFYVIDDQELVVSFSYSALWKRLAQKNRLKPDRLAFYEFLHFQRLFGDTTFDESTKTLASASILRFSKSTSTVEINRYWKPDFSKSQDDLKSIASDLAHAVTRSISTKTGDKENIALLLSGGMDSRVVLGGFNKSSIDTPPHCVTIGSSINNEIEVAASLAKISGAQHSVVARSESHYSNIVPKSVSAGGGMYSFQHGHFFNLDIPDTDLLLHGHGFDYFFQGMYLPSERQHFLGRPTRSWKLSHVGPNLSDQYMQSAKYRLKGINPASLLKPDLASDAADYTRANLESILNRITADTSESHDAWDYLTTGAPGRHYTYLNLLSASTLAEQRTVAFSNDIFDLYYSTPAEIRHGTQLLAETIRFLDPRLLTVRNANTNLRPDLSPTRLTIESWWRGARRRLGVGKSLPPDPGVIDRSWPTDSAIIKDSPALMSRVNELSKANGINSLDLFDEAKIQKLGNEYRAGNDQVASALLSLITIDEFASQSN